MQIKLFWGTGQAKWRISNNNIDLLKINVGTTLCRWVKYLLDPGVGNVGGEGRHSASSQVIFSFVKSEMGVKGRYLYIFYNSYGTLNRIHKLKLRFLEGWHHIQKTAYSAIASMVRYFFKSNFHIFHLQIWYCNRRATKSAFLKRKISYYLTQCQCCGSGFGSVGLVSF